MTISEKIANLKGFIEGIELDTTKPENKIIAKIADILEDMAYELEDVQDSVDTLDDYAEELDEDLGDLEEYIYGEDCECCDDECCDDDCDCCCDDDCCDEYYEVECPECGETINVDGGLIDDELICPACNKKFSLSDEK